MHGDINLLPDSILHKKALRLIYLLKVLMILLLGAMLVSAVLILPYRRWELESRLDEINAQISAQGLKDLEDAENRLTAKTGEVREFLEIIKQLPDNSVRTTEVITGIASLKPGTMTITDINYQSGSRSVILEVISPSREDIALFLKRLHDDAAFASINISAISGASPEFRFTVILILK